MNNKMRFSPSKAIAGIAIMTAMASITNDALAQNLSTNQKTKTEINYKDILSTDNVKLFWEKIGVHIPSSWINYTDTVLDKMDTDERIFAEGFIKQRLSSIPEKDRVAYTMVMLNMILDGHTGKETTTMLEVYSDQAMAWIWELDELIKSYFVQLVDLNKKAIADNQKAIADNQKAIADNQKEYLSDAAAAELKLQEIYEQNPQSENTKKVATLAKKIFDQTKYSYSDKTAGILAVLNIK